MYSSVATFLAAASASAGFLAGLAATRPRLRRLVAESARTRWLAEHDTLTGLPNRAAARHRFGLDAAAGRADVIVLLDLDDFKTVNDTWGHQAGDALLVAVADRLTTACRRVDAQAFRLGGDEFVLLLPPVDPHKALRQTTAILAELGTALPLTVDQSRTGVAHPSASAGLAVPGADDTYSELLHRADIALYHAKSHRTGPRVYTPDLRQPAISRRRGEDPPNHTPNAARRTTATRSRSVDRPLIKT